MDKIHLVTIMSVQDFRRRKVVWITLELEVPVSSKAPAILLKTRTPQKYANASIMRKPADEVNSRNRGDERWGDDVARQFSGWEGEGDQLRSVTELLQSAVHSKESVDQLSDIALSVSQLLSLSLRPVASPRGPETRRLLHFHTSSSCQHAATLVRADLLENTLPNLPQ